MDSSVSFNCPAWHSLQSSERRPSIEELPRYHWPMDSLRGMVLTVNWCRGAQSTVGRIITKQMILNTGRKRACYMPIYQPASKQCLLWFLLYFFDCEMGSLVRGKAMWNSKQACPHILLWLPSMPGVVSYSSQVTFSLSILFQQQQWN